MRPKQAFSPQSLNVFVHPSQLPHPEPLLENYSKSAQPSLSTENSTTPDENIRVWRAALAAPAPFAPKANEPNPVFVFFNSLFFHLFFNPVPHPDLYPAPRALVVPVQPGVQVVQLHLEDARPLLALQPQPLALPKQVRVRPGRGEGEPRQEVTAAPKGMDESVCIEKELDTEQKGAPFEIAKIAASAIDCEGEGKVSVGRVECGKMPTKQMAGALIGSRYSGGRNMCPGVEALNPFT
jgi:hypothetical protein